MSFPILSHMELVQKLLNLYPAVEFIIQDKLIIPVMVGSHDQAYR